MAGTTPDLEIMDNKKEMAMQPSPMKNSGI
jgi:hypothetical protein